MKRNILILLLYSSVLAQGQNITDTFELKIYNYSFKNKFRPSIVTERYYPITINIHQYIKVVETFNQDGNSYLITDTINRFSLNSLDSIPINSISHLLASRLELLWRNKSVPITAFGLEIYRPDREPHFANLESDSFSYNRSAYAFLEQCPAKSYIVFNYINFIPEPGKLEQLVISDRIGFIITGAD